MFIIDDNDGDDALDFTYPKIEGRRSPNAKETASAVVIVTLIAAFVFFVLRHQAEQARAANCAGNLQQIGTALFLYAQDYDDTVPNRLTGWPRTAVTWQQQEAYTWRHATSPYLHSTNAFRCLSNPMNQMPTGCETAACGPERYSDGFTISYAGSYLPGAAYDDALRGFCGGKGEPAVSLESIQSPSATIAIVEDESPWSEFDVLKPSFTNLLFTGHDGGGNYLFADGHVAQMEPSATFGRANLWMSTGTFSADDMRRARHVLGVAQ